MKPVVCVGKDPFLFLNQLFPGRFAEQVHGVFKGYAADVNDLGVFRYGSGDFLLEFSGMFFREQIS